MTDWPLGNAAQIAVITTRPVLDGAPVRMVSHDEEDGGWQFLCGTTQDVDEARVAHLADLLALDPTLVQFASLPLGWVAEWTEQGTWRRRPSSLRARLRALTARFGR